MPFHKLNLLMVVGLACSCFGCGSSDTSDKSSAPKANSGSSSDLCDPVAFAMLNAANSNAKLCTAIPSCITENCNADAMRCAGANYAKHDYTGGICNQYYDCVKNCNCVKSCVDQCDPDSLDCSSCLSITFGMGCTLSCVSEIASCGAQ